MTNQNEIEEVVIGGYTLRVLGNEAEIKEVDPRLIGEDKNIVVPEYIGGKKVISINKGAYYDYKSLKNVEIPYSVEFISSSAFGEVEQVYFYGDMKNNSANEILIQTEAFLVKSKNINVPLLIHFSNLEYFLEEHQGVEACIVREYNEEINTSWDLNDLVVAVGDDASVFLPQNGLTEDMLKKYNFIKDEDEEIAKLSWRIAEEELLKFEEKNIFSFYHIAKVDNVVKYSKVVNNGFSYEYI